MAARIGCEPEPTMGCMNDLMREEKFLTTQRLQTGLCAGRLRVEDGVHVGHLEVEIKIKLNEIPGYGLPFVEGGYIELRMSETLCSKEPPCRRSRSLSST